MTAQLRLYNTLTRKKEDFSPLDPSRVRMYVCGPTVYDFAHIGNARPVIVFDVLFRLLRHIYGAENVIYTRNITDVDDKINDRAARDYPDLPLNDAIRKVTEGTNAQFQADVAALGCLPPTHQPRATEHIEAMKALCERLVAKGVAYVAEGHVLFSPEAMNSQKARWPTYGKLANRSLDEMIAGARVDVAPYKKGPTDFVLWKPSADHEPGWASPCGIPGKGRPGWHIECSAMSMATLLEPFGGGLSCDDPLKNTFDIHGGGIDLVFPHHENEIAQSCCAFGSERMAQIWMHNGFLQVEGQKMSKSLGNFRTIREVLADWPGESLVSTCCARNIASPSTGPMRASPKALPCLRVGIARWGCRTGPPDAATLEALSDDLNTPAAIAAMHQIDDPATLKATAALFGLLGQSAAERAAEARRGVDVSAVEAQITARLAARAAKNWAESDRIRDELAAMGIQLKDGKDEAGNPITTWEVKR